MLKKSAKRGAGKVLAFVCAMLFICEPSIASIPGQPHRPGAAAIAAVNAPETIEAPEPVLTSLPARMRIPALSLDYEIRSMGADGNGTMMIAPYREKITWFDQSAIPGNSGNAIFGGHNTWGGVRSLLFDLYEMKIGDEMEIEYADGTTLRFRLESVFIYRLRSSPANLIMDVGGEARVTLITCRWPYNRNLGTSENRIVATFKEESIFVMPDRPVIPYPPRIPASSKPPLQPRHRYITIAVD